MRVWLRAAKARNSSPNMRTVNARLRASARLARAKCPHEDAESCGRFKQAREDDDIHCARASMGSAGDRGGLLRTSSSAGSITSASAGSPSVTMLIQRRCSGKSGSGSPITAATSIAMSSPVLPASR